METVAIKTPCPQAKKKTTDGQVGGPLKAFKHPLEG
jgi:hypothetical protein